MKKLNTVLYNKLLLQVEEAETQHLFKLASNIEGAIEYGAEGSSASPYSQAELDQDVQQGLWKLATCVLKYYNAESLNAEKLDEVIGSLGADFVEKIEEVLDNVVEPTVPGEQLK